MSARKPSLATQLKNAKIELAAQSQQVGKLNTELEREKSYRTSATTRAEAAERELGDIHTLLDNLPNSIKKRDEGEYRDRPAMTRLAAWFAVRA